MAADLILSPVAFTEYNYNMSACLQSRMQSIMPEQVKKLYFLFNHWSEQYSKYPTSLQSLVFSMYRKGFDNLASVTLPDTRFVDRYTNFDEKCSLHSSHIGSVRLTESVNKLINMIYEQTMEKSLIKEEFDQLTKKLESNEFYQKSKSLHKYLQFKRFYDGNPDQYLNGQIVRREDDSLIEEGRAGFDEKTAKLVIYNFKDGLLHSENDEPAVQYPGHWEIWENGLIKKVTADGGDTEGYWENGVPVRIERNLAERRKLEAENGN